MEIKKLVNKSLPIQIADALEQQIANGEWKIGSKIPSESELMEIFGVSRNTLREAIRFLVISGVVDARPGDGTYITTDSVFNASMKKRLAKENIAYILETRLIFEPQLVEIAAIRGTDEELKELKKHHEELLVGYDNSWGNYVQADISFHCLLAHMCHNPLLEDLYCAISEHLPQYLKQNFPALYNDNLNLFLHKDLMAALEKRDGTSARKITETMIKLEMQLLI